MNDLAIIRLRELATLDQIQAYLLDRLAEATLASERRAIKKRLHRLNRLRAMWRQSPKMYSTRAVNFDQKGNG